MSHFTVLVIGEDVDGQLAPYSEQDEKYMQFIVKYQNDIELNVAFKEWQETHQETREDYKDARHWVKKWHGYEKKGRAWGYFSNLDAKWDWYSIGGRWTGYFLLKPNAEGEVVRPGVITDPAPEGTADVLYKRDIDVERMRENAREEAGKMWDKVRAITGPLDDFISWEDTIKPHLDEKGMLKTPIDDLRSTYHAQRARKAMNEYQKKHSEDRDMFWVELDRFIPDHDTYVRKAGFSAIAPYAYVKDGEWYGSGDMGWWGMSSNDDKDWPEKFNKMFDELPDDTMLTLVDCHI